MAVWSSGGKIESLMLALAPKDDGDHGGDHLPACVVLLGLDLTALNPPGSSTCRVLP